MLASWAGAGEAQRAGATLSVSGGSATDARGARSSAVTIIPSFVLTPDRRVSIGLSGSGTRFAEDAWALGGAATVGARVPITPRLAFAATGVAAATTTSFDATYATAALLPSLEARVRAVTLFAGGQLVQGTRLLRETRSSPGTLLSPGVVRDTVLRERRSSVGPVFGALVTLAGARPDRGATLLYREEWAHVAEESVTDRTVTDRTLTAAATIGRLQVGATAGQRWAPDEAVQFGSVSATVALTRVLALQGSAGSYPSSRLTALPGGRFVSAGLLLHGAAGRDAAPRMASPPVRGAPPPRPGMTRLVLRAPAARRVEVAGDWSSWQREPATRAADGTWYVDVPLLRGEYRYAFRVDGERWTVPEGAPTVDDGFGGRSGVIVVP